MFEVWIGKSLLVGFQKIVHGLECGSNVSSKDLKFSLDNAVGEFFFVLIDELGKEITENFVVESKTIRLDFFRAKLGSNGSELVSDNVEKSSPFVLISSISHNSFNESIFAC